jgi:hypothetical protein
MATKAGVWIDHQQATVVLITSTGQEIKKVSAGGGKPSKVPFTKNDFIAEDKRERKIEDARKKVFDAVLACIRGADALLILGPGEAKGEFNKHIKAKKLRGLAVTQETADRLTDRQLAAKVGEYFSNAPASKPVAKKKTAKPIVRKLRKKVSK